MSTPRVRRRVRKRHAKCITLVQTPEEKRKEKDRIRKAKKKHEKELLEDHQNVVESRLRSKIVRLQGKLNRATEEITRLRSQLSTLHASASAGGTASDDESDVRTSDMPTPRVTRSWTLEHDSNEDFEIRPKRNTSVHGLEVFFDRAQQRPRVFSLLTGLKLVEFGMCFERVKPTIENYTFDGTDRKQKRESKVHLQLQFFVYLYWLKQYLPYWHLAFILDLPERYLAKILYRVSVPLHHFYRSLSIKDGGIGGNFTAEDLKMIRERQKGMQVPGLTVDFVLDGCHLPVSAVTVRNGDSASVRAEKKQRMKNTHNHKHACSAVNVMAYSTVDGQLILVDGPKAMQEGTHLKALDLYSTLKKYNAVICADAGLHVVSKAHLQDEGYIHGLLYYSVGPTSISLCSAVCRHAKLFDKEFVEYCGKILMSSRLISKLRIVIENVFALAKQYKYVVTSCLIYTYVQQ